MAADFSMWGAEQAGSRLLEQDQQKQAQHLMLLAKGAQDIEVDKARVPLYQAQARKEAAEANMLQQKERAMAEWLTGAANNTLTTDDEVTDPLERGMLLLERQANFQSRTGDLNGARQTIGTMSSVVSRQAAAGARDAQRAQTIFNTRNKMATEALSFLRLAESQEDLTAAGDAFERTYGVRPPIFSMPFTPENKQRALATGLNEQQAAQIEHNRKMEGFRERQIRAQERTASTNAARAEEYIRTQKAERERKAKIGEKPMGAATARERAEADALVSHHFPKLPADDAEVVASRAIAQAKEAVKKNPGANWNSELEKAIAAQRATMEEVDVAPFYKPKNMQPGKLRRPDAPAGKTGAAPVPFTRGKTYAKGERVILGNGKVLRSLGGGEFEDDDDEDND